jgi:pimeloyl-ACP methyl ester carboxylesterase
MSTLSWTPAHVRHGNNGGAPAIGVALAIHGLNYDPQGMAPVTECLAEAGVDCLTLSLHGHGDNYLPLPNADEDTSRLCSFTRVTLQLWCDEVMAAYALARARADELGIPLLLTGYSLGALIGSVVVVTEPQVRVDRLLLFAPALALPPHGFQYWLAERAPRRVLPSLSPRRYRANRGTPGAAYAAAYDAIGVLEAGDLQRLNVPALVFVDRRDEIVSSSGVESIARQLSAWRFVPVHKSDGTNGRVYHHLVIGQDAVGKGAWDVITEQITNFVVS